MANARTARRRRRTLKIQEARIAIEERGRSSGRPVVVLPSEEMGEPGCAFLDLLAAKYRTILIYPPGYGRSILPDSIRTPDDASYVVLEAFKRLDLRNVVLIGFSLGGWIAAEMASKDTRRIGRLGLIAPVGIKPGGPYDRDIADIHFLQKEEVRAIRFADPGNDPNVPEKLDEASSLALARHRIATAKLAWEPYFHNPALIHRLSRVDIPTLVLWGREDRFTEPAYGRAYAKQIAGAKFQQIANAGHFPHLERPDAVMDKLTGFLAT